MGGQGEGAPWTLGIKVGMSYSGIYLTSLCHVSNDDFNSVKSTWQNVLCISTRLDVKIGSNLFKVLKVQNLNVKAWALNQFSQNQ